MKVDLLKAASWAPLLAAVHRAREVARKAGAYANSAGQQAGRAGTYAQQAGQRADRLASWRPMTALV